MGQLNIGTEYKPHGHVSITPEPCVTPNFLGYRPKYNSDGIGYGGILSAPCQLQLALGALIYEQHFLCFL
jgi:hypothetical protein